jgi:hypothetical protein
MAGVSPESLYGWVATAGPGVSSSHEGLIRMVLHSPQRASDRRRTVAWTRPTLSGNQYQGVFGMSLALRWLPALTATAGLTMLGLRWPPPLRWRTHPPASPVPSTAPLKTVGPGLGSPECSTSAAGRSRDSYGLNQVGRANRAELAHRRRKDWSPRHRIYSRLPLPLPLPLPLA